jgi:hypothetical protein
MLEIWEVANASAQGFATVNGQKVAGTPGKILAEVESSDEDSNASFQRLGPFIRMNTNGNVL